MVSSLLFIPKHFLGRVELKQTGNWEAEALASNLPPRLFSVLASLRDWCAGGGAQQSLRGPPNLGGRRSVRWHLAVSLRPKAPSLWIRMACLQAIIC